MDSAVEDASRAMGAGPLRTACRVVLPSLAPAVIAVALLSILRSLDTLEIEWVLGARDRIDVLGTVLYAGMRGGGAPVGSGTAMATVVLVAVVPLFAAHRWIAERRAQPEAIASRTPLGRWTWPAVAFVVATLAMLTVVPLLLVVAASLGAFSGSGWSLAAWTRTFTDDATLSALQTTLALAVGVSFIAMAAFTTLAYFVSRAGSWQRQPLDLLTSLPGAVPGVVVGLGVLVAAYQVPGLGGLLHGKVAALVAVVLLTTLPVGIQVVRGTLDTLGRDVEDASLAAGASRIHALRTVLLPLIVPVVLLVGMLTFALAVRSTTPVALLATDTSMPLTVLQLDLMRAGVVPLSAVVGVIVTLATVGVAVAARLIAVGGTYASEEPTR